MDDHGLGAEGEEDEEEGGGLRGEGGRKKEGKRAGVVGSLLPDLSLSPTMEDAA